jgi:hypothetical protein
MEATQKFVFRTQSNRAYTYGVGEVVVPGVTLFRTGEYDLLRDEAEALLTRKLKQAQK